MPSALQNRLAALLAGTAAPAPVNDPFVLTSALTGAINTALAAPLASGTPSQSDNSDKISTTAFVKAAIALLKNGAASGRDTFKALSDLIDANTTGLSNVSSTVATQLAAGVPTLDSFRSLAMYVARSNGKALGLANGFVDDFTDVSGVDLSSTTGAFVDTLGGALIGGVGGPVLVIENTPSLPKMTGNTTTATGATGYVASTGTALYNNSTTYDVWHAFDGDRSSSAGAIFDTLPSAPYPIYIQLQVPTAILLAGYALTGHTTATYAPRDWTVQGSNDGTSWTVLDTQTGQAPTSRTVYTIPKISQGAYKYHRMNVTASGAGATGELVIYELELLQYTYAFETHPSQPAMTSNSAVTTGATGHVAFASSEANQTNSMAWLAMDGTKKDFNTPTRWSPTGNGAGAFIGRGTPAPIQIGGYAITKFNDSTTDSYPTAWRVQGTNDATAATNPSAAAWVTLDQRTGAASGPAYARTVYNVPAASQGLYKYHRLLIDTVGGGYAPAIYLAGFELLQVMTGIEGQTSIPFHTGANTVVGGASGYAITASSTYAVGNEPWRAADGLRPANTSGSYAWVGTSATDTWLRQLPSPVKMLAYRIAGVTGAYSPSSIVVHGSNTNNGVDWTLVDTRSLGSNFWSTTYGDWHYFMCQTPGSYSYYRFTITAPGNSRLPEVEFLQGTTGNMDFKAVPRAAPLGVPAKATMWAAVKANAGAITINTNLVLSISRNGTAGTFKPFVMSQLATLGGYTIYTSASLDLSDLPSGSQMVARAQTTDGVLGVSMDSWMPLWG